MTDKDKIDWIAGDIASLPLTVSVKPTAEDWQKACKEIVFGSRHVTMYDAVEARAHELASLRGNMSVKELIEAGHLPELVLPNPPKEVTK